jgi:hypothetical protein
MKARRKNLEIENILLQGLCVAKLPVACFLLGSMAVNMTATTMQPPAMWRFWCQFQEILNGYVSPFFITVFGFYLGHHYRP